MMGKTAPKLKTVEELVKSAISLHAASVAEEFHLPGTLP
jgi:hypothetical protein